MALNVGELYASFGIDSKGLDKQISGIQKQCESIASGLTKSGAIMTAAITAPLVKVGKEIFKAGTDFEAQMSKVQAIGNLDTEKDAAAIEALTQKALEMGSTTQFTATEAGEALEYMAMAGWKTDSMLAGLKPIMDLAAASGESLGKTSDIVTDAMTAFGYTLENVGGDTDAFNEQVTHFSDVLAAAATNANTNVGMMGESFKYIAPLAGTLGYSVDDMAVALGLMANNGIKASQAGTSMRNVLQHLIDPTEEQEGAMKELGLSLYDSNGKIKDFSELMGDMRKAAKESGVDMQEVRKQVAKLDEELEKGTITEAEYDKQVQKISEGSEDFLFAVTNLAGARGLGAMLAVMNASDKEFNDMTEAIMHCDGATAKMAQTMLDNTKGKITLFKSALEGLEITLWTRVAPAFDKIVETATGWVDSFRKASPETQIAALKLAGLAAAAGPAMLLMGRVVSAVTKLAPALAALVSPLGIVAGGLAMMAIAAVDANNDIGKMLVEIGTNAATTLSSFNSTIEQTFADISTRMPALAASLSVFFGTLLPAAINTASTALLGIINTLSENSDEILGVGLSIINGVVEGIANNLPKLIPAGFRLVAKLTQSIIQAIPVLALSVLRIGEAIVKGLADTDWAAAGTSIVDGVKNVLSTVTSNDFADKFTTVATSLITGLGTAIGNAFHSGGEIIRGIATALSTGLSNGNIGGMLGNLNTLGVAVVSAIGEAIKSAAGGAADIMGAVGELLKAALGKGTNGESMLGDLSALGESIIGAIVMSLGDMGEAAGQIVTTLSGVIGSIDWSEVGADLGGFAVNLINSLVTAISSESSDFSGVMTAIGTGLGKAVNALATVAGQIVASLVNYMLNPALWVPLGKGIVAILGGIFDGIFAFIDETFGGNIFTDTNEVKQNIGDLANANAELAQTASEAGESMDEFGNATSTASQQAANTKQIIDNLNLLEDAEVSGIGEDVATLINNLNSGTGTAAEIAQWTSELEALKQVIEAINERQLGDSWGALMNETYEGNIVAGMSVGGVELSGTGNVLESALGMIDEALASNPVPVEVTADISVTPSEKIDVAQNIDWETQLSSALTESGQTYSVPVESSVTTNVTEVTVGDGAAMQTEAQTAVDTALAGINLTADVSVATSVTVEISDSDASTVGATLGEELGGSMASGISSKSGAIASAAGGLLSVAGSALRSSNTAYSSGVNFGEGFVRGINSKVSAARAAAQALANAANSAVQNTTQEGSPSRVMIRSGQFFGEGFVVGIHEKMRAVKREASAMATAATNALSFNSPMGIFKDANRQAAIARRNAIDYRRLALAMAAGPTPVLELDGVTVAEVNATNTAKAQNGRTKAVAMRYGSK